MNALDFAPPDNRLALLEQALRHFTGSKESRGRTFTMLYTDRRRPTPGWRGLTDPEVLILEERGYATAGPVLEDGSRSVKLTAEGVRVRDSLPRRPR